MGVVTLSSSNLLASGMLGLNCTGAKVMQPHTDVLYVQVPSPGKCRGINPSPGLYNLGHAISFGAGKGG